MSVLIKNLNMPTSCENCPFCDNDAMCTVLGEDLFDLVQAEVVGNLRYLPEDCKSDSCPLVPVPPHGRLIDADRLKADNPRHMSADVPYVTEVTVEEIIDAAPTVIEADELIET